MLYVCLTTKLSRGWDVYSATHVGFSVTVRAGSLCRSLIYRRTHAGRHAISNTYKHWRGKSKLFAVSFSGQVREIRKLFSQ